MPDRKMPRMLFILQLPPPVHGASLMNRSVAESKLIRDNFEIDIVDLHFSDSVKGLGNFSFRKIIKAVHFGLVIAGKVISRKPDLVYFNITPKGFAFYRDSLYVFLLKTLKRKIVFHLHSQGVKNNASTSALKRAIYMKVFKDTHIICVSEFLAADVSGVYTPDPIVVPNGIQICPESLERKKSGENTVPAILFISNYMVSKGILTLIDALGILKDRGYEFQAKLIGAPYDLTVEMLEKITADKQLSDSVEITGPMFGKDKVRELQEADILVFPSTNDVFGLVLLEAMQFRLPVISTLIGGIPEVVVDNETGLLVEAGNPQMLSSKLSILLKDKDLRTVMGEKGYKRFFEYYTLEQFERNMLKTFQSLL
jgi:glycosyltransferase involved in cell wall biosynthesis